MSKQTANETLAYAIVNENAELRKSRDALLAAAKGILEVFRDSTFSLNGAERIFALQAAIRQAEQSKTGEKPCAEKHNSTSVIG